MRDWTRVARCRSCGGDLAGSLLDLGPMPLANRLLDAGALREPEPTYPLHVRVCESCLLAQHDVEIDPQILFHDYVYFSSTSRAWVEHAGRFVDQAVRRFGLDRRSLVVEIASNDGYLLRHVVERGIPALGIEPAANIAEVARARGIPTEICFFSLATARDLAGRGLRASLLVANNVLAHVPRLQDFLAGAAMVLAPGGVFVAEFPHLLELMEQVELDTIYHEHVYYFSLGALDPLFRRAGLRLVDVERLPTHGGSLRIFAVAASDPLPEATSVARVRSLETEAGLDRMATYAAFAAKAEPLRQSLRDFLAEAAAAGRRVAAFGAAAKGATLLNFCGVTADQVGFVVDETPAKIGKLMPGSRVPIVGPERLAAERPDYVLILPWNHRREIAAKLAFVGDWGGRLVIPVPRTEILA